jgi:hypothetical protein
LPAVSFCFSFCFFFFIGDKFILSSERMLRKDYGLRVSLKIKSLVVILKELDAKTNGLAVNRQS